MRRPGGVYDLEEIDQLGLGEMRRRKLSRICIHWNLSFVYLSGTQQRIILVGHWFTFFSERSLGVEAVFW